MIKRDSRILSMMLSRTTGWNQLISKKKNQIEAFGLMEKEFEYKKTGMKMINVRIAWMQELFWMVKFLQVGVKFGLEEENDTLYRIFNSKWRDSFTVKGPMSYTDELEQDILDHMEIKRERLLRYNKEHKVRMKKKKKVPIVWQLPLSCYHCKMILIMCTRQPWEKGGFFWLKSPPHLQPKR